MNYIIKPTEYNYNTNIRFIEELIKEYPFLSAEIIGRSGLGRGIFSLSVGNPTNSVIYVGGFHGSEWLTSEVLLLFVEKVCRAIKYGSLLCSVDIKRALTQLGITVIPCINPDGVEIATEGFQSAKNMRRYTESLAKGTSHTKWNANAFGVDLNHNFSAGWDILHQMEKEQGIDGPAPRQYGGERPESEAETKALTRLCRVRKFRQCLAMHSQGEEIYWQYGENTPKQSSIMAKILADSCGYTLVSGEGLSSHGGFKDWFIDEFHAPGFTFEIGKGENPLPKTELYGIYDRIEEALTLFALM
ncbi:MAG: M14 family metallocarboxypeptidase [Acutalibacteraceae bacterium]|nr:M14 family metallocarboxypeptidase [Acutalibacteraceae bacterium]